MRPKEGQCLAVPVTRLYDQGITVSTSEMLRPHIGDGYVMLHPATAKTFGLDGLASVKLDGRTAKLKVVLDEAVPASVALLSRSMGFPIQAPAIAELKKA